MITIFIILSCAYGCTSVIDLEVDNFVLEYVNPNFYNVLNVSIRRQNRHSPYYMNMYFDYSQYVGDNYTIKANVYEVIGGRNVLTPLRFEYTLCYFLRQDSFVGKMFREQLPSNVTCPFAPGIVIVKQLILHAEKLPSLPVQEFTYASLNVRTCTVIENFYNKELVILAKIYMNIKLKLKDKRLINKS